MTPAFCETCAYDGTAESACLPISFVDATSRPRSHCEFIDSLLRSAQLLLPTFQVSSPEVRAFASRRCTCRSSSTICSTSPASKRASCALDKQRVELNALVKDAVDACTSVIEERHHTLTVVLSPSPVVVDVASARSVQVICNLLNNAAKYQKEDGRVELTASAESGAAVIRVRDDGVGIAPEMIDRIFDRFVQIDSSQHRDQGGLGIGLSLVRAVVELHGGSVQARSDDVGRGSEFIVTLPIAPPQP